MHLAFSLDPDLVTFLSSVAMFITGYALFLDRRYRKLGLHVLVWAVVLTAAYSAQAALLGARLLAGLVGLAISGAEAWLAWRLYSREPPVQKKGPSP